jgi:hypothetical protein
MTPPMNDPETVEFGREGWRWREVRVRHEVKPIDQYREVPLKITRFPEFRRVVGDGFGELIVEGPKQARA